jgi:ANTAR domain
VGVDGEHIAALHGTAGGTTSGGAVASQGIGPKQGEKHPTGALTLAANEPLQVNDMPRFMGRLQRLCRAARRDLACCGVGVGVVSGTGELVNVVASSRTSAWVEELQFSLGQGPSLAAFAALRPVFVPNLMEAATTMWPEYAPAAHGKGVRAVFAFPLQVGVAWLGTLDVYQAECGALSARAQDRAFTFANLATQMILDAHDDSRETTSISVGEATSYHLYQANGIVMTQFGIGAAEAMSRIRAHAYAHERPLDDVAADIVGRTLILDVATPDSHE